MMEGVVVGPRERRDGTRLVQRDARVMVTPLPTEPVLVPRNPAGRPGAATTPASPRVTVDPR